MQSPKRVLIVELGQFLGGTLNELLKTHSDLVMDTVSPINSDDFRNKIHEFKPDVILMDDTIHRSELGNLLLVALEEFSDLRVMILNANQNQVHLFAQKRIAVRSSADLLSAL